MIAIVAVLLLICCLVCFCKKCCKRRKKEGKHGLKGGVDLKSVQLLGNSYKEKVRGSSEAKLWGQVSSADITSSSHSV